MKRKGHVGCAEGKRRHGNMYDKSVEIGQKEGGLAGSDGLGVRRGRRRGRVDEGVREDKMGRRCRRDKGKEEREKVKERVSE